MPPGRSDSGFTRFRRSLNQQDRRSLLGMAGFVVLLHVVGFGVLFGFVVPHHFALGKSAVYDVGVGVLAYTFGMRHAFDADHIAAVDNTTRKLIADGPASPPTHASRCRSASGSHSATRRSCSRWRSCSRPASRRSPARWPTAGPNCTRSPASSARRCPGRSCGSSGILNLVALLGIIRVFREMRAGHYDEQQLEEHLNKRGFMNRFLGRADQVGAQAVAHLPRRRAVRARLRHRDRGRAAGRSPGELPRSTCRSTRSSCCPVLFAAGMCLLDTIDGVFMNAAYGWAFAKPVRKVFYNITITAMSVAVALVIGTIELVGVLAHELDITSGPLARGRRASRSTTRGTGSSRCSLLAWLVALGVWRFGRIEERWSAELVSTRD